MGIVTEDVNPRALGHRRIRDRRPRRRVHNLVEVEAGCVGEGDGIGVGVGRRGTICSLKLIGSKNGKYAPSPFSIGAVDGSSSALDVGLGRVFSIALAIALAVTF